MLRELWQGSTAGAAGTTALNVVTYLDMTVRGRPSSTVPAQVAESLAESVGLDLRTGEGEGAEKQADNRRSGLGALLGYLTGVGVGVGYALARPRLARLGALSLPLAGAAVGAAAMVASDLPAMTTGASDPRTWSITSWVSDIVPHLAYGLVTVAVYEAFAERNRRL